MLVTGPQMDPGTCYVVLGRGYGTDEVDCLRCARSWRFMGRPLRNEAFFVGSQRSAELIANSFAANNAYVRVDFRQMEPHRTQLKAATCGDGVCDLWLDRLHRLVAGQRYIHVDDIRAIFPVVERPDPEGSITQRIRL